MAGESGRQVTVDIQAIRQGPHLEVGKGGWDPDERWATLWQTDDVLPAAAKSRTDSPP